MLVFSAACLAQAAISAGLTPLPCHLLPNEIEAGMLRRKDASGGSCSGFV
jgi:hypothetical protein